MLPERCVIDPERDCVSLERVEALEEQFREQREKSSATHKEFYNRIRELEKQNSVRDVQYKAIMEKLDCLTRTVNEIKDKAGKRWDMIVDKAIWAAVAAVIAFLLGRMGLGG